MDRPTAMGLVRLAAAELDRAMAEIRAPGYPRPHYISYLIRDEERWRLQARFGSLAVDRHERQRNAFADVRVGSWANDQVRDGGLHDNDKESPSYEYVELPFAGAADGVRHGLWRLTDACYREAVEDFLEKKSHELSYVNRDRRRMCWERRRPTRDLGWSALPEVDRAAWTGFVERASRLVRRYPDVKDAHVEFAADHVCRTFVDSEGSRRIECQAIWSLECHLWLLSARGDGFPWTIKHTVADPAELPDEARLAREIRAAVARLRRLADAPILRSFSGPALLDPVPAGLLMHEAVGHRLEGSRLLSLGEGQTFKDALGEMILPGFLTVRDDPTLARFEGQTLIGHYRFDDEGSDARDTLLVDRGKLVGFLGTRTGLGKRHRSNGHARSNYHERPISRMGVTIVESSDGIDDRALKQVLLEEIRRSGAPFGIRVMEATSGETATDAYNFQAFLGQINLAARVYPDGREEWIRGVDFVGTPLSATRGIIAAGRRHAVDNSYCGAESGYLPVSTVSPAIVVSELELQAKPEAPYTPYTFPIPWQ